MRACWFWSLTSIRNLLQICGIHFDGDRTHNQIERNHKPEPVSFSDDDTLQALKWAGDDTDALSHGQIGVRLRTNFAGQAALDGLSLALRQSDRWTNQPHTE